MERRIWAILILLAVGSSGCIYNHKRIDADDAFRQGRAWSGSASEAKVAGFISKSGEKRVFTDTGDTCYIANGKFYAVQSDSTTFVTKKSELDSVGILRTIKCQEKLLWYDSWKYGFLLDKDSSFSPLQVDGHPVESITAKAQKDAKRFELNGDGLRFDCSDSLWWGRSNNGQEIRLKQDEIATLQYKKPYFIINVLSGMILTGVVIMVSEHGI